MKRFLSVMLCIGLVLGFVANPVYAAEDISVVVNGTPLVSDVAPIVVEGRTLVPLRAIAEALGVSIMWEQKQQLISFSNDTTTFVIKIGEKMVTIKSNGKTTSGTIDVPPIIRNGRTFVPLRFLTESLNINISYDKMTNTVYIGSGQNTLSELKARELSTEGLIRAFKDAGLSVIDEVIYTSSTDPNKKLGRPGEYIAKINFNDSNFSEIGDTPELTIEQFSNKKDMEKRRDYIQSIVDSTNLNDLKYYIYDNNVFLFRIPYSVTPEKAAEYENVFNDYMNYVDITPIPPTKVDIAKSNTISLSGVKSATELESYLKDNFGELKTEFKTFNLKNYIRVIENEDQFKCFDIAIVIDWDSFVGEGYYDIRNSIKYTKEQKKAFEDSINTYQKSIADAAISAMPTKKIRGGFLDYGYEYPNLKIDYYEGAPFGWKNYAYSTDIFPYYEDTKITKFHWHSFNGLDDPYDVIGLF